MFGQIECGKLLMSAGADINAISRTQSNVGHVAADKNKSKFIEWAISQGRMNNVTTHKCFCLIEQLLNDSGKMNFGLVLCLTNFLCTDSDIGLDTTVANSDGQTAYAIAAKAGHKVIITLLLVKLGH